MYAFITHVFIYIKVARIAKYLVPTQRFSADFGTSLVLENR